MVIDEKFNAIVDAVCYWLGYQFKIGREQLIHEASLRYPIADTITAKGIAINRIVLEKRHPIFKSKKIDLVIFDKDIQELAEIEKDDTNLKKVYEFKLAKSETGKEYDTEHQRVFNDVVRPTYYHLWNNKDCYFLMCGKYDEFKTFFVGQKNAIQQENRKNIVPLRQKTNPFEGWQPEGLYKNWFGFKIGEEKEIEFETTTENNCWGLESFQKSYKPREENKNMFSNAIKIKTKCVAITPHGLENVRTHAAGIWKIEAVKN
ncbi:MAG: hypothetical protein LBR52_02355 [Prevotellaceae bacterium]|jgi:hypothetical protein|nr:hypothetical protein [Prevotellaceae bacterium]